VGKIVRVRMLNVLLVPVVLRASVMFAAMLLAGSIGAQETQPVSAQAPAPVVPPVEERSIELFNTHTRATVRVVYKRGAEFVPASLDQLNKALVDHRSGETHTMDPALFDQLYDLALAAGVPPSYEIISGYRSPESNSKMAAREGSGVSKRSLHMQGRAIDVRLKGCSVEKLRDLALAAKRGGVGYYQRSQFVHIDTGSFRTWIG
jgi:uncharacterized protein YcbK (DUF882 family)